MKIDLDSEKQRQKLKPPFPVSSFSQVQIHSFIPDSSTSSYREEKQDWKIENKQTNKNYSVYTHICIWVLNAWCRLS